jgi:hypothetical protein
MFAHKIIENYFARESIAEGNAVFARKTLEHGGTFIKHQQSRMR